MKTILSIGHYKLLLSMNSNAGAILKALSGATLVRSCYSSDREKKRFRTAKEKDCSITIEIVPDSDVGPALADEDDYGRQDAEIVPAVKSPGRLRAPKAQLLLPPNCNGNGDQP